MDIFGLLGFSVLLGALLLLRSDINKRFGTLGDKIWETERRLDLLEFQSNRQFQAFECAVKDSMNTIDDKLSKQESEIGEVKDMLVQLLNHGTASEQQASRRNQRPN